MMQQRGVVVAVGEHFYDFAHQVAREVEDVRGLLDQLPARVRIGAPPGSASRHSAVPRAFDKQHGQSLQAFFGSLRCAVVAEVVADRADDARFVDGFLDATGVVQVACNGFLYEQVDASLRRFDLDASCPCGGRQI
jgi:hypothetical protein